MADHQTHPEIGKMKWMICAIHCVLLGSSKAWFISTPASNKDWEQLAWVVTKSFDAPTSADSVTVHLQWKLGEQYMTYLHNYRHYVQTARRMKGKKYAVFVAKDEAENGKIVGVCEIGIKADQDDSLGETLTWRRRPTIGSLCVHSEYRKQGIGTALISRCERLVRQTWQEESIFAEVQVQNNRAFLCFHSCGYQNLLSLENNRQDADEPVMVLVQRRRKLEFLPHFLLAKQLNITQQSSANATSTKAKQWIL